MRHGPAPEGVILDLLDPARIDVLASRQAGEPRRTASPVRARRRPGLRKASAGTVLVLHGTDAGAVVGRADVLEVVASERGQPTREPCSGPPQPLASSDRELARLRSAVLDLYATLAAWPLTSHEHIVLVASGVSAAGALIALGAGLAPCAGKGDPLQYELLLDLVDGDPLAERVAVEVAPRISAAVLIDLAGVRDDWSEAALRRITTPVALVEVRGAPMARLGFAALGGSDRLHARFASEAAAGDLVAALAALPAREVFADVAAHPGAFGAMWARHAWGVVGDDGPTEICRSDWAIELLRWLWLPVHRRRQPAVRMRVDGGVQPR